MLSESKLTFYRKIVYAEGILIRHLLCLRLRKRHLLLLREGFTQKNFHQKSKCCCRANLKGGIVLEYVGIGLVALLAVLTVVSTVRFNRKPPMTREEYEEHERKRKGDE